MGYPRVVLFKQDVVADVLADRKRQTVRLKRPRVSVGRSYAVQTSYYSPSLGRVSVTGLRPCTLADLTRRDIDLEGWQGRPHKEFERYFAEINHFEPSTMSAVAWKALRARKIWCIEFEPETAAATPAKKKPASKAAKQSATPSAKRPAKGPAGKRTAAKPAGKQAAAKKVTRRR